MNFFEKFNDAIKDLEFQFPVSSAAPPSIFVIGVPRSGTTLITQLLAACTNVGYVNNLMARFWLAPSVGARLSREVLHRRIFTGNSNFGQTQYPEEPHEFGGFWRSALHYNGMTQKESHQGIDWDKLAETLKRIASVFEKPVVYKVFQLYWHLEKFHMYLPTSKWIWVRRNPVENALSLLHMRKEKTGGFETWFSARPLGASRYEHESPWVQVAAQVRLIEDWIQGQLLKIPSDCSFQVNLDKLCQNPEAIVRDIALTLNLEIFEENLKNISDKISPEIFDKKDNILKMRIENAFQTYFS